AGLQACLLRLRSSFPVLLFWGSGGNRGLPAPPKDARMTIDERLEALTQTVEPMAAMQRDNGTRRDGSAAAIAPSEQRAAERSRDMQTEILRGIEAFARGNFSRMHRIEASDTDTNTRIGALEERVLYLEPRRPPQYLQRQGAPPARRPPDLFPSIAILGSGGN